MSRLEKISGRHFEVEPDNFRQETAGDIPLTVIRNGHFPAIGMDKANMRSFLSDALEAESFDSPDQIAKRNRRHVRHEIVNSTSRTPIKEVNGCACSGPSRHTSIASRMFSIASSMVLP